MSKHFYLAISLVMVAFAGYELWLNLHLRHVNNVVVEACFKPAHVPPVSSQAVFYLEVI
jgi:hypothetical protein